MHAIEQSMWGRRPAYAAMELVAITDIELINKPIECEEKYRPGIPVGHTAIHICCHGIDFHRERPNILRLLIEKKADVNAKTDDGNTAAIFASLGACAGYIDF